MSLKLEENLNVLFEKLEKFLTSKTVVGEAIQVGNATLIPIIDLSFGLGTGGGDGTDDKGAKGYGAGAGLGAKATASAVIVIKGDDIQVIPIKRPGSLEKIIDLVPEIVTKVKGEQEQASSAE